MGKLDSIKTPEDFRGYSAEELKALAAEVRERIVSVVSETGGHLASSLGAVELTLALHYVYDTPQDQIVWDVGHQCYAHKILTGRNPEFPTIRQQDGLSGFPRTAESPFDVFDVGHASTSISVALGLAGAREITGGNQHVVAVIGDGSMTGGLAYEGLNNAGALKKNITVVLNDNKMSISPNVGAMSSYLTRIISDPRYNKLKGDIWEFTGRFKTLGSGIRTVASRVEDSIKGAILPGRLFEDLGFRYFGPIDGHNLEEMINLFTNIRENVNGPVLVHVITKKGKGYTHAETDSSKFHGVGAFEKDTGKTNKTNKPTFSSMVGHTLSRLAGTDGRIVAITAAMPTGTGLDEFAKVFPNRYFDVGIAEGHAVTFAGGLAKAGLKPVVALYSTFLQRAYDNIMHDVALQNLDVVFCIDRGGLTPDDGPTHHGLFDISILRCVPGLTFMSPKDENELQHMLHTAFKLKGPVAVRYPKGTVSGVALDADFREIPVGVPEILEQGDGRILLLALGEMVERAQRVGEELKKKGLAPTVVNGRFVKPFDVPSFKTLLENHQNIFTFETGTLIGGFNSAVMEFLSLNNIKPRLIHGFGFPDRFLPHGDKETLFAQAGLNIETMVCEVHKTI